MEVKNMAINKGCLTAKTDKESDEMYTPFYAVNPIVPYIPNNLTIWCPFDEEWSAYVQRFRQNGNNVIYSHIDNGQNFFTYEPKNYDVIISNPPFSIKDQVLKRLYELNKPFAILLPLNSLQRKGIIDFYRIGLQILCFDNRTGFHNKDNMDKPIEGSPFASAYFCRNILPKDLIIEHLYKYDRPLN
jgi:hypothetical protein